MDEKKLIKEGFMPIYKELAEIIGEEKTYEIFKNMRGQQITFPKRLFSSDYVINQVLRSNDSANIKKLALDYDYTEKHLIQLLKRKINSD
ncbi:MAG: Mor transcription activator family protein [Anaerocolumna sp.]